MERSAAEICQPRRFKDDLYQNLLWITGFLFVLVFMVGGVRQCLKGVDRWNRDTEAQELQQKTRVLTAANAASSPAADTVYSMLEECLPYHGVGVCSATAFDFIGRSSYSSTEKDAGRRVVTQAIAEAVR